jgi:gluconate 2-dehydrogenase gamma chain
MADEKNPNGLSRRSLFHIIGSAPAIAAVTAGVASAQVMDHAHMSTATAQSVEAKPFVRKTFLDDHQWKTVHVLCDLIIPADERSGSASQAGVPEFIDDWLHFRKEQDGNGNFAAQILGGLFWIDRESISTFSKTFVDASVDQQKQLLDRVAWKDRAKPEDHAWVTFFNKFRDLTVSGFFSSKMGIADLPYMGNRAVAHLQGCDPKVWAVIEERIKTGYKGLGGETPPNLLG